MTRVLPDHIELLNVLRAASFAKACNVQASSCHKIGNNLLRTPLSFGRDDQASCISCDEMYARCQPMVALARSLLQTACPAGLLTYPEEHWAQPCSSQTTASEDPAEHQCQVQPCPVVKKHPFASAVFLLVAMEQKPYCCLLQVHLLAPGPWQS